MISLATFLVSLQFMGVKCTLLAVRPSPLGLPEVPRPLSVRIGGQSLVSLVLPELTVMLSVSISGIGGYPAAIVEDLVAIGPAAFIVTR